MAIDPASSVETASVVALLRTGRRGWTEYAALIEEARSARPVLEEEQGLLADELIESATAALARWRRSGFMPSPCSTAVIRPTYSVCTTVPR